MAKKIPCVLCHKEQWMTPFPAEGILFRKNDRYVPVCQYHADAEGEYLPMEEALRVIVLRGVHET